MSVCLRIPLNKHTFSLSSSSPPLPLLLPPQLSLLLTHPPIILFSSSPLRLSSSSIHFPSLSTGPSARPAQLSLSSLLHFSSLYLFSFATHSLSLQFALRSLFTKGIFVPDHACWFGFRAVWGKAMISNENSGKIWFPVYVRSLLSNQVNGSFPLLFNTNLVKTQKKRTANGTKNQHMNKYYFPRDC